MPFSDEELQKAIWDKVALLIRLEGIPYWTQDEALDPEIEALIKGEG